MSAANGRLACIKSTLYGNVELLQRRLISISSMLAGALWRKSFLPPSLKSLIVVVLNPSTRYHELFQVTSCRFAVQEAS